MPRVRTLSPAEVAALEPPTPYAHAQVARAYDTAGAAVAAGCTRRPAGAALHCASAPAPPRR